MALCKAAHAELDQLLANVEGMQAGRRGVYCDLGHPSGASQAMEAQLVDVQFQLRKWQKCHHGLEVLVSQQAPFPVVAPASTQVSDVE